MATIDATSQVDAIPGNSPPTHGAQYTLLNLSATYTGVGSSALTGNRFDAVGSHGYSYDDCYQQLPPPVLALHASVSSGQTVGGNICYEVALGGRGRASTTRVCRVGCVRLVRAPLRKGDLLGSRADPQHRPISGRRHEAGEKPSPRARTRP